MVDDVSSTRRTPGRAFPDPILRVGIAGQTLAFGLFGILATLSGEGPSGIAGTSIACAVCATTIPAAIAISRSHFADEWWTRRSRLNNGFVIYAEVGVTTVLLTFHDHEAALLGATLLTLVGACAAHFCRPMVVRFHVVWSTATVIVLVILGVAHGGHDPLAIVLRGVVVVVVVNGGVLLLSAFSAALLASSRQQLSNAETDPLTGLLNRRGLESHAENAIDQGMAPPSVVLLDIDHFKAVNDTHGHATGDAVLRRVAIRLTLVAGQDAVVSRFGGEEFVVLLTDPQPDLLTCAERLRLGLTDRDDDIPITASAGAAAPSVDGDDPASTFSRTLAAADAAMYRAKINGRDRTELA